MSKFMYGISRQKARENFDHYLTNPYSEFLCKRDYLDQDLYEMYIDPIYDEDHNEQIGVNYICYFDGKREEFSDISQAEAYSISYFYDYCVCLACESFYFLFKNAIFTDFNFSVFDFFNSSGEVFSSNSIEDVFDWLKVVPGHTLRLTFDFYTPYDYSSVSFKDECRWLPMLSIFRYYLFFEEGLDNVDLCDFDFFFDFLRLQERLTGYDVRLSQFTGYNTFLIGVYHRKDE